MDRNYSAADPAIANLDATARILLTTVTHKLVPSLAAAKATVDKSGSAEDVNWSDTLNHFATSAKQIDHLWQEIQPGGTSGNADSGFDMSIVTPIDSGHPIAEQLLQQQQMLERGKMSKNEAVFVGVQVPPLLSTMIPAEDAACVHTADSRFNWRDAAEEEVFLAQINAHNNSIGAVVDAFSARMEQWRVEKDSASISASSTKGKIKL